MEPLKMSVQVDTKDAEKKIERVTRAAARLKLALDLLRDIEIEVKVIEEKAAKRKWWQFWK